MFRFKQFTVQQERSAMKVGTDGVLLGSWTPVSDAMYSVLDIGAGTGLVSLMLAQRCAAEQIDAIEIDEDAYEQTVDNFENSPWNDRLFCYHAGLDEFVDEIEDEYDLIVCNPPYFKPNDLIEDESRKMARYYDSLPFDELIEAVACLLSENGIFSVIIPYQEEENFITIAREFELFPFKITRVKGNGTSPIKRSLMAFCREEKPIEEEVLVLEIERHHYTPEFIQLVKDFYLNL